MPASWMQEHWTRGCSKVTRRIMSCRADLLLGILLLGAPGCTALSDFSVHQCETHADCASFEGGVWRCDDARCVPGCASNDHCAATYPGAPLCTEPGGSCVSITT